MKMMFKYVIVKLQKSDVNQIYIPKALNCGA